VFYVESNYTVQRVPISLQMSASCICKTLRNTTYDPIQNYSF